MSEPNVASRADQRVLPHTPNQQRTAISLLSAKEASAYGSGYQGELFAIFFH